jgi:NAD(P)H-dependent flavin oxidoreductase YrpB (nitropropane dioxygenase family)
MAGQIAGLIDEIKPVKNIIDDIINEAHKVVKNNNNFFGVK